MKSMAALEIRTTRFGSVQIEADDVICFPNGMLGLDGCRDWVLLADAQNDALGWLQSTTRPEVALAVVSPRRFVPDYQVRTPRAQIASLSLDPLQNVHVLAIVSKNELSITLNLKAPLIINLERRVGRQVINSGEQPVQYELCEQVPRTKAA
jgi:flagellar assembly factor FliW